MTHFESNLKTIPFSQERVYTKLSDLQNLEAYKDQIPTNQIENLSFDSDSLSLTISPFGKIALEIVERKACESILFSSKASPINFDLRIQLTPTTANECQLQLIVEATINPFMQAMVQKPLLSGMEQVSDVFATLEY